MTEEQILEYANIFCLPENPNLQIIGRSGIIAGATWASQQMSGEMRIIKRRNERLVCLIQTIIEAQKEGILIPNLANRVKEIVQNDE